jgi:hypothetical protein
LLSRDISTAGVSLDLSRISEIALRLAADQKNSQNPAKMTDTSLGRYSGVHCTLYERAMPAR